jgi:hypothetical protein
MTIDDLETKISLGWLAWAKVVCEYLREQESRPTVPAEIYRMAQARVHELERQLASSVVAHEPASVIDNGGSVAPASDNEDACCVCGKPGCSLVGKWYCEHHADEEFHKDDSPHPLSARELAKHLVGAMRTYVRDGATQAWMEAVLTHHAAAIAALAEPEECERCETCVQWLRDYKACREEYYHEQKRADIAEAEVARLTAMLAARRHSDEAESKPPITVGASHPPSARELAIAKLRAFNETALAQHLQAVQDVIVAAIAALDEPEGPSGLLEKWNSTHADLIACRAEVARLKSEREDAAKEYQRGRADQVAATTNADYSWKPRCEELQAEVTRLTDDLATVNECNKSYCDSLNNLGAFCRDATKWELPMSGHALTARDLIRELRQSQENCITEERRLRAEHQEEFARAQEMTAERDQAILAKESAVTAIAEAAQADLGKAADRIATLDRIAGQRQEELDRLEEGYRRCDKDRRDLGKRNNELISDRNGWHQVVKDCERIVEAVGTAGQPSNSNLPNLVRYLKVERDKLRERLAAAQNRIRDLGGDEAYQGLAENARVAEESRLASEADSKAKIEVIEDVGRIREMLHGGSAELTDKGREELEADQTDRRV